MKKKKYFDLEKVNATVRFRYLLIHHFGPNCEAKRPISRWVFFCVFDIIHNRKGERKRVKTSGGERIFPNSY